MTDTKQGTSASEHPRQLGADVHCVSMAIRRALDAAIARAAGPEMTGARGMVLGYIARRTAAGEAVYQRDLEERFHIRRSSVTALLKAMEQDGFITRTSVERDARLKSLALTEKGRVCNQRLCACVDGFETALCRDIPPPQLEQLYATLDQLLRNASDIHAGLDAAGRA